MKMKDSLIRLMLTEAFVFILHQHIEHNRSDLSQKFGRGSALQCFGDSSKL